MATLEAKMAAALDRYLSARGARGEGRGTYEEFSAWARRQDIINHEDIREIIAGRWDEVWIADTRVALGLDEPDESDGHVHRFVVEAAGKPIRLPHLIVNAGQGGDDFGDTKHWQPRYATVGHHRRHAELMIRCGNVKGGREQLAANTELLRRAGGNQSALIGDLLS